MIHVVIGTKAQLIKMAPIMWQLNQRNIPYNFISTGQHKDTMDDILANFGLDGPDQILYKGKDITSVASMTIWAITILAYSFFARKRIFKNDKKGLVLIHGDTLSTLIGAIMGKLSGQKVAHVESGLRSYNWFHPFPEELTRVLAFKLSDYYFCPGEKHVKNVARYKGEAINCFENTLIDSLRIAQPFVDRLELPIPTEPYIIVTIHRFENIRSRSALERIIELIEIISKLGVRILFILHKPTERSLAKFNLSGRLERIHNLETRPRYDYFSFIKLTQYCEFTVSDGGSNQEECSYLGKPILLLRQASEREEGLGENGVLSKYSKATVEDFCQRYNEFKRASPKNAHNPSEIIVNHLISLSQKTTTTNKRSQN